MKLHGYSYNWIISTQGVRFKNLKMKTHLTYIYIWIPRWSIITLQNLSTKTWLHTPAFLHCTKLLGIKPFQSFPPPLFCFLYGTFHTTGLAWPLLISILRPCGGLSVCGYDILDLYTVKDGGWFWIHKNLEVTGKQFQHILKKSCNYPVILRILGFFSSSFSRKIHHPCLLAPPPSEGRKGFN